MIFSSMAPIIIALVMTFASISSPTTQSTGTETAELTNDSFLFRNIEWGLPMTDLIDAVIAEEYKNGLTEDGYEVYTDKFVLYDLTVGGHTCNAMYFIVGGQYADGAYILHEEHSNYQLYYSDYTDLVEKYTKKYGPPVSDEKEWIGDSIYKDKPDKYGMAIALGELQLTTVWEAKDGSKIKIFMSGDNFDITARIDYTCPGYASLSNSSSDDEGI